MFELNTWYFNIIWTLSWFFTVCIWLTSQACKITRNALHWRHNERDGVSNHQSRDCLLNRLFRRRSTKTSKLRITGLYVGNSPQKGPVRRKMFPFDDVIMRLEVNAHFAVVSDSRLIITQYFVLRCRSVHGPWWLLQGNNNELFIVPYCIILLRAQHAFHLCIIDVRSRNYIGTSKSKQQGIEPHFFPPWISKHMSQGMWDEINFPLPNFNGCKWKFRSGWLILSHTL